MKKLAAQDYEDILQCCIPCFEGLLDPVNNKRVMDLLYTLAYWHGLAKMRLHTQSSLTLLENATTWLGAELRQFDSVTSEAFDTRETTAEASTCGRAAARRLAKKTPSSTPQKPHPLTAGRRCRRFNLRTIKTHSLGDYVPTIRRFGTTDSYNTQIVSNGSFFMFTVISLTSVTSG